MINKKRNQHINYKITNKNTNKSKDFKMEPKEGKDLTKTS